LRNIENSNGPDQTLTNIENSNGPDNKVTEEKWRLSVRTRFGKMVYAINSWHYLQWMI